MPPFIRFTREASANTGRLPRTEFVNVSQIATASYEPEHKTLEIRIIGLEAGLITIRGDEAEAAMNVIRDIQAR